MKDVIEKWITSFSDKLVEVDGYKARILNSDDVTNLGYDYGCGGYITYYNYTPKSGHTMENYNLVRNENQSGGYSYYVYLTVDGINYEVPFAPSSDGDFQVNSNSGSIRMLDYLEVVISKQCDPTAPQSRNISSPNPYSCLNGNYWTMIYRNNYLYYSNDDKFYITVIKCNI